jgi:hypothetical protein
MIYFPGTINIVSTRLYCHTYIHYNSFTPHLPAMHVTYSVHAGILKLWRGRLPCPLVVFSSSLWITSSPLLCPGLTDAPCPCYEGSVSPLPRWRSHSQGPHTLPFQGTRHYLLAACQVSHHISSVTCYPVTCYPYLHICPIRYLYSLLTPHCCCILYSRLGPSASNIHSWPD